MVTSSRLTTRPELPTVRRHGDGGQGGSSKLGLGVVLGAQAVSALATGTADAAPAVSSEAANRAAALEAQKSTLSPSALAEQRRALYRAYVSGADEAPAAEVKAKATTAGSPVYRALEAALEVGKGALSDVEIPAFVYGTERLGLGVRVSEKVLAADDPLITGNTARREHLADAAAHGKPVTYVLAGGGLYPRAGFGGSVPVGGTGYVTAGFAAHGGLHYSVLAPYAGGAETALQLAKNFSTALPLDAAAAHTFAREQPGAEVTLSGRGAIVGYVGAGVGQRLLDLGTVASVHATAGVDVAVSKQAQLKLKIAALDADHVRVTLSEVHGGGTSVAAGASVGLLDGAASGSKALESWVLRDVDHASGGQLRDELELLNAVDFRAAHTSGTRDTEVASYVIDLRVPAARTAFDGFRRLDTQKADQLVARGPGSGVTRATLSESAALDQSSVTLDLGPLELLSSIASSTERHGTVKAGDRTLTYDRADLAASWSSVLTQWATGNESLVRELISVRDSAAPAPESHFHLAYTVSQDGITSADDVRSFVRLGSALGVIPASQREALLHDEGFLGQFEETDRRVDVYIADAGLARMAKASPREIMAAYSAAYEELERPGDISYAIGGNSGVWKRSPWLETSHPSHGHVMSLLESDLANRSTKSNYGAESTYRAITGRDLHRDAAAYRDGRRLTQVLTKLAQAPDAAARAKVFAREARVDLDFGRELVAMARLAGPDAVRVRELSLVDTRADGPKLALGSGAALADPQATVDALLGDQP